MMPTFHSTTPNPRFARIALVVLLVLALGSEPLLAGPKPEPPPELLSAGGRCAIEPSRTSPEIQDEPPTNFLEKARRIGQNTGLIAASPITLTTRAKTPPCGSKTSTPTGSFDNTEMALIGAENFGIDMDLLNERLFIKVGQRHPHYNVDKPDPANPVLRIGDAGLPISKNSLRYTGFIGMDVVFNLNSLVVHAPVTDKVYIPFVATALIDGLEGPKPGRPAIPNRCWRAWEFRMPSNPKP
ncbi:MAG: hypothetical protein JXQ27_07185 [Acidobacteria bacterium]|nr:hypothetical protein [Acidobacteriota bacterium]